jgi:hypothetical protein
MFPASRKSRVLLLLASLACSLVGVEAALRWTGRFPIPPEHVVTARPELYQEYKPYGYRLWPSRTTTYLYPRQNPRRLTLVSNRDGFRSRREFGEPDARRRIVVVGDSMVFGDGVEESERFTERLEAGDPSWRVDNLGMTAFGPDLMLRALEEVGLRMKPAVVIITMYTDDFRRVRPEYAAVGFEIPKFALRRGNLVSIEYPHPPSWMRWSVIAAARETMWRASRAEWALNQAILDRFRELAAQRSFELVLLFLPGRADTPNDVKRRTWLRQYAERTGVPFLDLTEPILGGGGGATLFVRANWHLNPQGHAVVARELRRFLAHHVPDKGRQKAD